MVYNTDYCIFAACLVHKRFSNIRKSRGIYDFNEVNKMEKEIKRWKTHSVKHKVAIVLMVDGVSFSYTEADGRLVPETNGMSA